MFFQKTPLLLFLCFLLGLNGKAQSSTTTAVFTHVYQNEVEVRYFFEDSIPIFIDYSSEYEIAEILRSPNLLFDRSEIDQKIADPFVLWSRIQLKNEGDLVRRDYFQFCSIADSVWIYTIEEGRVVKEQLSGTVLEPSQKSLPSAYNYVPFTLQPEAAKTYYFKLKFTSLNQFQHLTHFFIQSGEALIHRLTGRYAKQSFYAGVMLLFCLLGLLFYHLFREMVFVYFSSFVFFFVLYFLDVNNIINTLFLYDFGDDHEHRTFQHLIISGLLMSYFLFMTRYIRLPQQMPGYYRIYLYFTIYAVAFPHIAKLLGMDLPLIVNSNNINILIWLIVTMIPTFIQARKKEATARILLLAIGVLFTSVLIFVSHLINGGSSYGWATHAFQIGTLLFSGILLYGLFDRISEIQGEKRRYEELDQLKSRFFANISHEFRTPLTLVLGPAQELIDRSKDAKDRHSLQLIKSNGQRLLSLINQLLDLSKLEAGKMALEAREQNIALLLKGIVMSFESLADKKNIRLHFVAQQEVIPLWVDKDKLEKIFYNLLSNAFKFTPAYGEISVMVVEHEKEVEILVRDTGIGISETRLPHIFDRFFQGDDKAANKQEGTGIGLALVKELIALHQGQIHVESQKEKGASFIIRLPKGKGHLKAEETRGAAPAEEPSGLPIETYSEPAEAPNLVNTALDASSNSPLVLIIEDNADVRAYIREYLSASFQILEAVNGQEGIDIALEQLPDLVISDVMMPLKDGYEVCQVLKSDQRSSHIPVILLTAKAAQEEKLKGLETGADDYLIKPFDTKELEVRARKLIELRRQLRQRFSAAEAIEPQAIQTNAVDQAFLKNICHTIESNLTNGQFSVEFLAQSIGMSRVHLNRKLKALTDQSANKFIQAYRLQKAYELLKQKKGNVSEIAFETGFSSTAYFVKCFGDKYGKTPGTLLQE